MNGGGQIRLDTKDLKAQKAYLSDMDSLYHAGVRIREPSSNPEAQQLYRDWLSGEPYSEAAQRLLHTSFHAIEKTDVNPLAIKW